MMTRGSRLFLLALLLGLAGPVLGGLSPVQAQPAAGGTLRVATREAPPFAMRGPDGQWHGLAIDLWRRIADKEGLAYRFVPADLHGMVDGVRDGSYDISVGALTVTPDREAKIDFTHPYYTTGFGIAVRKTDPAWFALLGNLFSWSFLQAVAALAAVLLVVGLLFWLAERRANAQQFGGGAVRGLGSGFWFSAVTMTTVGYGDKAPVTPLGRAIALIWMFGAIILISTFTGMIASSLTAGRLAGEVAGPADLGKVSVGSIKGSASDDWLTRNGIAFSDQGSVQAGLKALANGRIDAFVYDKPILRYMVRNGYADDLRVLPRTFGRQDYGLALPLGSPLRERLNVDLLRYIESDEWLGQVKATLGQED